MNCTYISVPFSFSLYIFFLNLNLSLSPSPSPSPFIRHRQASSRLRRAPKEFLKIATHCKYFPCIDTTPGAINRKARNNMPASGCWLLTSDFHRNYTHRSRNLKAIKANIIAHKSVTDVNVKETLRRVSHRGGARSAREVRATRAEQTGVDKHIRWSCLSDTTAHLDRYRYPHMHTPTNKCLGSNKHNWN